MRTPGPLPFMKTMEDAVVLCKKKRDNFYVTAFMIEAWLGQTISVAMAEYAEKKNAEDRAMQTGQAWRKFQEMFARASDPEFPHVFECLCRFSEHEESLPELLWEAFVRLSIEHDCTGDFVGPKSLTPALSSARAVALTRQTVERLCEWLDAVLHWQTHEMFHLSPASFDPDADKRELAALGINQRHFAQLSDFSKAHWHWHHGEAAERFKDSPKWQDVGKAMASKETKNWNHPDLDAALISLWPLVKRYKWTYRDLMAVARQVLPPPHSYPLEREQDVAAYCSNVLGLRKSGNAPGKSSADGKPHGHEIALRLFKKKPPASSS